MTTYILLFRGINVGGKRTIKMAELKACLAEIGLENVQTYIQSGNVVFQSDRDNHDALSADISACVGQQFGFQPSLMLLTQETLNQAIAQCPFEQSAENGKLLHFYFLANQPQSNALTKLNDVKADSESISLSERTLYLLAPDGIGRSTLVKQMEKRLDVSATGRNWNTVNQLQAITARIENSP